MVENKYNLTVSKCKKLIIKDRSKVCAPIFWRNDIIEAWCICKEVGPFYDSDDYWIGIYDENALRHAGKLEFYFTVHGGMCSYNFNKFYDQKTIENKYDQQIQEMFLEKINYLIDEGILEMPKEKKNGKN